MTINNNFVAVPAQSKSLDTNTVTTAAGVVHRQVVSLASSDTTGTYLGFNSDSAKAYLTNTSLPLPTGASTSALQTTGNNSLSSIDGKTATLVSGRVPVDGSAVTQPISAASLPLPTGAATAAQQPDFGTAGTPSPDVLTVQGISGGEPLSVDVIQPVITKTATSSYLHLNANGTTTVKSGAGVLRRIVINTRGGIVNTLTIYDNTAATGAVIGAVDTVNAGGAFDYELDFTTGLTVVLAGGTAADITIIYE